MDAARIPAVQALASETLAALAELSSEIGRVALVAADGVVLAATPSEDGERLARLGRELLAAAVPAHPYAAVSHVEVALPDGSVFVVSEGDRVAVATTRPEPAAALVLHDLRECLRRLAEPPSRKRRRKAGAATDDA